MNHIGFDIFFGFGNGGGGNQSLNQVLAKGDRTKRDINELYILEEVNSTEFLWLQGADSNLQLIADTFTKENSEIVFATIGYNNTLTVENVSVLFEGNIYENINPIIDLPYSSQFSLRLIAENKYFLSVIKLAATPPLSEVLNIGDRSAADIVPFFNGNFYLLPEHKSQDILFSNNIINEDKIVWVNTDCLLDNSEYKIENISDYQITIRAKDGVTIIGGDTIIPKNAVAVLKCLGSQFINTFLLTFRESILKEAIYYIDGQDNKGFIDLVEEKNTTGVKFTFERIGVGDFNCPNFDPKKHTISIMSSYYNGTMAFNWVNYIDDNTIRQFRTNIGNFSSDSTFRFGGWIIIRQIKN